MGILFANGGGSTPQSLGTADSPTFAALTLDGSETGLVYKPDVYGTINDPDDLAPVPNVGAYTIYFNDNAITSQAGGRDDQTMAIGYNYGPNTSLHSTDDCGFGIHWESCYITGGDRWCEFMFDCRLPDGTDHRFMQHNYIFGDPTDKNGLSASNTTIRTGTLFLKEFDNTIVITGNLSASPPNFELAQSFYLNFTVNNALVMAQKDSAGTGNAQLYLCDSNNQTRIVNANGFSLNDCTNPIIDGKNSMRILHGSAARTIKLGNFAQSAYLNLVFSSDWTAMVLSLDTATKLAFNVTEMGFFGSTTTARPASANQAAVSLDVDVTGSDTVDKAAINANFSAIQTLVNEIRANLVSLNLIKGAA